MNVVPNYYHKFKCIADKCHHNCCIGWEIDIDSATMDYYVRLGGNIGKKLLDNIGYTDGVPHFILGEKDRCPFLMESSLCEIITTLGEDALCDICTDHPRFRNFYENFTEIGLGLCCEEAARIILEEKEPFSLVTEKDYEGYAVCPEEELVLNFRSKLFDILQKRDIGIKERISVIENDLGFSDFSLKRLCDVYLSLERLDDKWTDALNELKGFSFSENICLGEEFEIPFEQLACYFVFRHLGDAIWDGELVARVKLALAGCFLIRALCLQCKEKYGEITILNMEDFARMYSCEVEYSEENIKTLLKEL